jgi:hypothetical protein
LSMMDKRDVGNRWLLSTTGIGRSEIYRYLDICRLLEEPTCCLC